MCLNLFMQHMPSLVTQDLVHIKKGKIWCKLACYSWKRFEKIFIENQIFDTSMQRLFDSNFYPNPLAYLS